MAKYRPSQVPVVDIEAFLGRELERIASVIRPLSTDSDSFTLAHDNGDLILVSKPDGATHLFSQVVINKQGETTLPAGYISAANDMAFSIMSGVDNLAWESLEQYSANATAPTILFRKSRNTTTGAHTVVNADDSVGNVYFMASDGDEWLNAAAIVGAVDGTAANGDMPGRIGFYTSADGGSTLFERMRIRNTGQVQITGDGVTPVAVPSFSGLDPIFAVESTRQTLATFSTYKASADGAYIALRKSRNASIGGHTAASSNDILGALFFYGSDGSAFQQGAFIAAYADGAHGSNDMPTRLSFFVCPDASGTLKERMRVNNEGYLSVFDTSGNALFNAGPVGTHGGIAVYASAGSGKFALMYFYDNGGANIRSYIGHSGTVFDIYNNTAATETDFWTKGSDNGVRASLRIGGNVAATAVGFQGTAPIVKPAVTGSRGGNAALASLLTQLANYGLITDSSTA